MNGATANGLTIKGVTSDVEAAAIEDAHAAFLERRKFEQFEVGSYRQGRAAKCLRNEH